jgi:protocatechuate 3,4-dioxygenase beta subunit
LGGRYQRTTDENGKFQFTRYRSKNESGYFWLRAVHAEGYVSRNPVNPLPIDDITVTMIKGGLITGRVTNAKGEPVIGAVIKSRMERDAEGKPPMQRGLTIISVTDDRGVYRFWGLAPGNYIVFTNSNIAGSFACPNNELTIYRLSLTSEKATEVTVTSGVETNGIDIHYRKDQGRIK